MVELGMQKKIKLLKSEKFGSRKLKPLVKTKSLRKISRTRLQGNKLKRVKKLKYRKRKKIRGYERSFFFQVLLFFLYYPIRKLRTHLVNINDYYAAKLLRPRGYFFYLFPKGIRGFKARKRFFVLRGMRMWKLRQKNYFYKQARLRRKQRRTKIKGYWFLIFKKQYYRYGFFSMNFRRRFTRNLYNLNFTFKYYVQFKRNRKLAKFFSRFKHKKQPIGVLAYLVYYLQFQFFMLLLSVGLFPKTNNNFLTKFRVFSILKYFYPRIYKFYVFYVYCLRRKQFLFKFRDRVYCKRFLQNFYKKFFKSFLRIGYLFKHYFIKFQYYNKFKISKSPYGIKLIKDFIKKGRIFVNGQKQYNVRKRLRYGDYMFINPKYFFFLSKKMNSFWWNKLKFNYKRTFTRHIIAPWCSVVLNNLYSRNSQKRILLTKRLPKKYFEIYFVLYR